MAVEIDEGVGNNVLSFLIPNRQHPSLGSLVWVHNDETDLGSKYHGYLGYVCLALAAAGIAAQPSAPFPTFRRPPGVSSQKRILPRRYDSVKR
jgi:hypothetical protein